MYNEIKNRNIKDLQQQQLEVWLSSEIIDLANDVAHNMPDDLLTHTCERIKGLLLTQYRSWSVGEIHAAWQVGLSNESVHKITVQRLIKWLKQSQSRRAVTIAIQNESNRVGNGPREINTESPVIQLYAWASSNFIYLDFIDPSWPAERSMQEKRVSPKIVDLAQKFIEAKKKNTLPALARKLKNREAV